MKDDKKKNLPAKAASRSSRVATSSVGHSEAVNDTAVDAATDAYLRAQAVIEAINANLPDSEHLTPIPKDYVFHRRDVQTVDISMQAAFELIGGTPRLIQTANKDPKWFYEMWSKTANRNGNVGGSAGAIINIVSPIAATPGDVIELDSGGRSKVVDAEIDDDFAEDEDDDE